MASNVLTYPLGPAESLVTALGEELDALAGQRLTRLAWPAWAGDTTLSVETTLDWPSAGVLYLGGVRHTYTSTLPDRFLRLAPPVPELQRVLAPVLDWSRSFSSQDKLRRAVLVAYAEGADLDVIGRNYDLGRFPGADDDAYRAAIQALAFAPRGTVATIETAPDFLVGPGNYEVFEDLVNFPCQVFISIGGALDPTDPRGKTYVGARDDVTSTGTQSATLVYAPTGQSTDSVVGVFLAPALHVAAFDVKPSAQPGTPWAYVGAESEASAVTVNGDGSCRLRDTGAPVGAAYSRALNVTETSDVLVRATVRRVAASTNDVLGIRVSDGARCIALQWTAASLALWDVTGAVALDTVALDTTAHAIELRKIGGPDGPVTDVEVLVDGVAVLSAPYADFSTTANRTVVFGSFSAAGTFDSHWSDVEVFTRDRHVNYWNARGLDGETDSGSPARLESAGSAFDVALAAGRPVVVRRATAAHGRAGGAYRVTAVGALGAYVDVQGLTHSGLEILSTDTVRVPAAHFDGFTNADAGIRAQRTTGAGAAGLLWAARCGGAAGNAIGVELVDPSAPNVPLQVNVVGTDITVTLGTSPAGALISTAAQVAALIAGNTTSAALVEATPLASGAGVMVVAAAADLSGGEDGKRLTIAGAVTGGNNATRLIATRIDERTVRLGSHSAPANLVVEATLCTWRKDPNFPTETDLEWEVLGSADVVTAKGLSWTRALYGASVALQVEYLTMRSGEILGDESAENGGSRFPFYLGDPYDFLRTTIDKLTVAGVIPDTGDDVDKPKFHPNERIDLPDVAFISDAVAGEFQRALADLTVGPATTRIVAGFAGAASGASSFVVTRGRAIACEVVEGALRYGQLVSEGAPTSSVSFAGRAVATYGVWLRFVYAEAEQANRGFWDDVTDAEVLRNVPTRRVAGWQLTVAATLPSAEWVRLYDVAWDGSDLATSAITDRRVFLFESTATLDHEPTWGAGDDRDDDRAVHGVTSLERFASAVLAKLAEIQSGTASWWTEPVEALDQKVSRNGDMTLAGAYAISTSLRIGANLSNVLAAAESRAAFARAALRGSNACHVHRCRLYPETSSTARARIQASSARPAVIEMPDGRIARFTGLLSINLATTGPLSGGAAAATNVVYYFYARISTTENPVTTLFSIDGLVYSTSPPDANGHLTLDTPETGFALTDYAFLGSMVTGDVDSGTAFQRWRGLTVYYAPDGSRIVSRPPLETEAAGAAGSVTEHIAAALFRDASVSGNGTTTVTKTYDANAIVATAASFLFGKRLVFNEPNPGTDDGYATLGVANNRAPFDLMRIEGLGERDDLHRDDWVDRLDGSYAFAGKATLAAFGSPTVDVDATMWVQIRGWKEDPNYPVPYAQDET